MQQTQYQMMKCGQCGAALPVRTDQDAVTCRFCNSEYEVVKVHGQRVNGHPQFDSTSLLLGGIGGFILGGIVFTSFGRSMAKRAIAKGMDVTEEAIERAMERGEK